MARKEERKKKTRNPLWKDKEMYAGRCKISYLQELPFKEEFIKN